MSFNRYANLVEATNDLTKRGFSASFKFNDGAMTCLECKTNYQPTDMKISETHRFEGYSNPADNSMIYAVECKDGKKGMIITPYGPYADQAVSAFMKKVEIVPIESEGNIAERTKGSSRK